MAQTQIGRLELGEHTPSFEMLHRLTRGLGQGFVVAVIPTGQESPISLRESQVVADVTMSDGIRVVAAAG